MRARIPLGGRLSGAALRAAEWLLARAAPQRALAESVAGDLREEAARRGAGDVWVARQTVGVAAALARVRLADVARRAAGLAPHLPDRDPSAPRSPMASFAQDIRFAWRTLGRRRAVAAIAVATIALGVGAATAIFTVLDGMVLRALPYREPGRLVDVWRTFPDWRANPVLQRYWNEVAIAYPEYEAWRARHPAFSEIAAWRSSPMVLTGSAPAEQVPALRATASLLPLLGVRPALGRGFLPGEDAFGAPPVAMLGHDAWRARFGGDSGVLGRTLVLDGRPHVVVGVLPRGFRLLGERSGTPDFWVPAGQEEWDNHANNRNYRGVARLAPGVTLDAARREMDAFFRARPGTATPPPATGARVEEVRRRVIEPVRAPLLVLFAAAGLLLLATCANVATLLLGEAVGREGEIATRVALGASRGRVARQLLTEHVLLAALGAALGVAVALAATRALVALAPPSMPRAGEVGVSARSLAFALAAALLTAALFGLAPLLALVRAAPGVVLRAAASRGSRARGRLQWVGAGVQIALSVVLLVGAALFGRSLAALSAVDPGFRPQGLLWVRATLPRDAYATAERRRAFHERAVAAIAALPGVGAASAGLGVPFGDGPSATTIQVADTPGSAEPVEADAQFRVVLPGFLETLGVPLQVGRPVTRADGAGAPRVVLVNETFARRFWPSSTALGKRVQVDDLWYEVVGIVGDVRHGTLRRGAEPTFYLPAAQTERWGFSIVVRAACRAERDGCDPARLAPSVRRAIQALDANVPVPDAEPVTALVARTLSDDRYRTMVVAFFALAAAALAAVGVYGVTVCAVNQRLRELAIRMALGASHGSLLRAVIGATAAVAAVGAVAGAGAAAVASRALPRFLFGVAPTDAATYVGVVGAVLGVAVLAGWLPARRAARADPATIMRAE